MKPARPSFLILFCTFLAFASSQAQSSPATVSFTLDFPQSNPSHYSIVVDSTGKANYVSGEAKSQTANDADVDSDSSSTPDEPYRYNFALSPQTRQRIFDLAANSGYFSGNINFTRHNVANTGDKILAYKDDQRNTQAKYNYTENASVQQLTTLFQNLSSTLEYGRRLEQDYHFQKLALDDELKSMERQANENGLVEIQVIAPILKKIINDSSVVNVSRARAEKLLSMGNTAAAR